jgi:hypothetical protein
MACSLVGLFVFLALSELLPRSRAGIWVCDHVWDTADKALRTLKLCVLALQEPEKCRGRPCGLLAVAGSVIAACGS